MPSTATMLNLQDAQIKYFLRLLQYFLQTSYYICLKYVNNDKCLTTFKCRNFYKTKPNIESGNFKIHLTTIFATTVIGCKYLNKHNETIATLIYLSASVCRKFAVKKTRFVNVSRRRGSKIFESKVKISIALLCYHC